MTSPADDLNAEFTADQWLSADLRNVGACLGWDESYTEQIVHAWQGLGADVALARAAYELESL